MYTEPGDFVILGGYPSAGKTMLATQFAVSMASTRRVGIFSLETRDRKLYDRIISQAAKIPFDRIKRHDLRSEDFTAAANFGNEAERLQLDIIDAAGMSVADIQAISLVRHYNVIFIDYLQLLQGPGDKRFEVVTNISLALHTMAGTTGITVVALAQLTRPEKGRKNLSPTMSSLRESGQLEQDADAVFLVYLDDDDEPAGDRILKIGKNKEGGQGFIQ